MQYQINGGVICGERRHHYPHRVSGGAPERQRMLSVNWEIPCAPHQKMEEINRMDWYNWIDARDYSMECLLLFDRWALQGVFTDCSRLD